MSRIGGVTEIGVDLRLARDGGPPARTRPEPPMFPGGMELGAEEIAAATRVLSSKNVFRYYGVGEGPHEVADFEREFAAHARREARALPERRLVRSHLRADRCRRWSGRRGDRARLHVERDPERGDRVGRDARSRGGRRVA